jgi:uncharacterized protein (TIGR02391 family)
VVEEGRTKEGKLPVGNVTDWLANVSKALRDIQVTAFEAYEDASESEEGPPQIGAGVKKVLQAHLAVLLPLIPEDFPASRLGMMHRHIHFCDKSDMRDLVRFDVPDVMEKAEAFARDAEEAAEAEYDVRNLLDDVFAQKLGETMSGKNPDYHALVLNCSVILADRFKNKTGLADDDMGFIGKAFSPKDPILMVPPNLNTETNKNYQSGSMFLFQGFRAYFRNTHAHGVQATDQEVALQALTLFSLLSNILASATKVGNA